MIDIRAAKYLMTLYKLIHVACIAPVNFAEITCTLAIIGGLSSRAVHHEAAAVPIVLPGPVSRLPSGSTDPMELHVFGRTKSKDSA